MKNAADVSAISLFAMPFRNSKFPPNVCPFPDVVFPSLVERRISMRNLSLIWFFLNYGAGGNRGPSAAIGLARVRSRLDHTSGA